MLHPTSTTGMKKADLSLRWAHSHFVAGIVTDAIIASFIASLSDYSKYKVLGLNDAK